MTYSCEASMNSFPNTPTHDKQWDLNSRFLDLQPASLSTCPPTFNCYIYNDALSTAFYYFATMRLVVSTFMYVAKHMLS